MLQVPGIYDVCILLHRGMRWERTTVDCSARNNDFTAESQGQDARLLFTRVQVGKMYPTFYV